jgi:hypothetical protein
MNEPDKVDLTPLDPAADADRWSRLLDATRLRVASALLERELDPFAAVVGWGRPILAAAAVLLLVLGAADIALRGRPAEPSEARRLAYLAEASALHGRAPTGAEVIATLRAREVRW